MKKHNMNSFADNQMTSSRGQIKTSAWWINQGQICSGSLTPKEDKDLSDSMQEIGAGAGRMETQPRD